MQIIEKKCKSCEKLFSSKKSSLRKFCSRECYYKSKLGIYNGNGFKKGMISWNKGKKMNFIPTSAFKKGQIPWNKGIKSPKITGDKHFAWKNNPKYRALHMWIERMLGKPTKCEHCGKIGYGRQMHWANKSQNYQRNLTDWIRLCAKCHAEYDGNRGRKRIPQLALAFK